MSIKSRIFGQPWQHRDPEIRARGVAEGDTPELREALPRIAEHDEDPGVRLAALKRIDTEPFWLDARLRESDPRIVEAADAYLVRAIMQHSDERLVKERVEWFRRIEDAELIRRAARHAPDRSIRAEALARVDSPGFLGDRVVDEADEELALSLIDRIDQVSTLQRIAGALRKKSKRRARAVEDRLHHLQAASGNYDPAAASATQLVERAEALARGQFEGNRTEALRELESNWAGIESPREDLARRFNGAIAILRRAMTPLREASSGADDSADPAGPQPDPALLALVERLEAADDPLRAFGDRAGELLGEFDRCWNAIDTASDADQGLRERALPILQALQKNHQQQSAVHEKEEERPQQPPQTDFNDKLDRIAGLLEDGHLADAQSAVRELRSQLDRMEKRQRPHAVLGRLGRLEGRLREMRNWEHWSDNQIRDELIERVEALVDADQHPDAISAALKEARAQWQRLEALEILPGDKRRHAAPAGQWRRFQAACKRAFEAAQPYFEKRHEVQAENLAQLEAFLEQGHALVDDDEASLDKLKQFMRGARLAIRRLDDLPPKSRGRSAARLRELMDALSARLDAGFEAVELEKRRLVTEAQQLQHESDLATAIDKAKALQARWQQSGSGRRRVEQQLWKEFREPIDPLFEKVRENSAEQREQQEAELNQLQALCEQAEALTECDDEALDGAEGRLRALQAEWASIGRKPRNLIKRFEQAERTLRQRVREREQAHARQVLNQYAALAKTTQQLWQARNQGESSDLLIESLSGIEAADELTTALLETARRVADPDVATANLADQAESNAEQARQVLIEMELLAGLESPAEDREARMNYQVERLARRLGERDRQPGLAEELAGLRERWYRSFPLPVERHEAMAKRYEKCQNVLDSMSGTE